MEKISPREDNYKPSWLCDIVSKKSSCRVIVDTCTAAAPASWWWEKSRVSVGAIAGNCTFRSHIKNKSVIVSEDDMTSRGHDLTPEPHRRPTSLFLSPSSAKIKSHSYLRPHISQQSKQYKCVIILDFCTRGELSVYACTSNATLRYTFQLEH